MIRPDFAEIDEEPLSVTFDYQVESADGMGGCRSPPLRPR